MMLHMSCPSLIQQTILHQEGMQDAAPQLSPADTAENALSVPVLEVDAGDGEAAAETAPDTSNDSGPYAPWSDTDNEDDGRINGLSAEGEGDAAQQLARAQIRAVMEALGTIEQEAIEYMESASDEDVQRLISDHQSARCNPFLI